MKARIAKNKSTIVNYMNLATTELLVKIRLTLLICTHYINVTAPKVID
jgi:hypothetical protein